MAGDVNHVLLYLLQIGSFKGGMQPDFGFINGHFKFAWCVPTLLISKKELKNINKSTKNKRLKMSAVINTLNRSFEFQFVGAATQQQAFLFKGAISLIVVVAAANIGNTKRFSGFGGGMSKISNNNELLLR